MNKKPELLSNKPQSPMEKAKRLMQLQTLKKELEIEIDGYKRDLLEITTSLDVLTLKTGDYTITRKKRVTPKVVNFVALREELDNAGIPYSTDEVFSEYMKPVFKKLVDEKRIFAGLEAQEIEYIDIRVTQKKGENV